MELEYNTSRGTIPMREYGRHVQKMVDYILTLEDKELRSRNAAAVVELMCFLNPQLKTMEEYKQKIWDHLFVISDFKLDVDSPFPIPDKATYRSKPQPLKYPKKYPRYAHLGKNVETVMNKALKETNDNKRNGFINTIAHYMKLVYSNWHKELVHDDAIRGELSSLTDGQLEMVDQTPFVKHVRTIEREDYGRGGRQQNRRFGNNKNRGGGGGGHRDNRDNRGGGGNGNNRNKNFKKRY
jgi:hypothetical protein